MRSLLALIAITLAAAASAADSVPLFNAVLTMNGQHRFVLTNASGESSRWLELGEAFDGHVVKSFDAKANTLDLEHAGVIRKVTLVNAAIGELAASTKATLTDAEDVLQAMRFDEMMAKILAQQKDALKPMIQQSVARSRVPEEHRARYAELQTKILDETFATMAGPEMRTAIVDLYSEVFSKEELTAISTFYGTPAGQSMIDKQPAIQQKMMQIMMGRMNELGPRMQKMTQEFQAEISAKAPAPVAPPPPK